MIRASFVSVLLFTLLLGVVYPLTITGIANLFWPSQATGSTVIVNDKLVGSAYIGQPFSSSGYFVGRPSATAPTPYTAFNGEALSGSTGSNLGPLNEKQSATFRERYQQLKQRFGTESPVPIDLLTASGSGLDPHISPAAAKYQMATIARERHLTPEQVHSLILLHTETRTLGLLGEPRVNVLLLNLALDDLTNHR